MKQKNKTIFFSKVGRHCLKFFIWLMALTVMPNVYSASNFNDVSKAMQQKVKVTGVVKDEKGIPLPGVTVTVKGTKDAVTSDLDGHFAISLQKGDRIIFTYVGFVAQEFVINNDQNLSVTLKEDSQKLNEVVVVGFATQKKANLTGAVATIDVGKTLESKPLTDVTKALQGTTPGLNITFNSGNLSRTANMNIRGAGTIVSGSASGSPLVLVDGVPTDLSLINPADVATMSVLKDAASASIYGARAAFGVILITTKSGKSGAGKVRFSYSGNTAVNNPISLLEFLDPTEEIPGLIAAGLRTDSKMPEFFGASYDKLLTGIQKWKANYANNRTSKEMVYGEDWEIIGNAPYFYRVWDTNKETYAKNAVQTVHNLTAQGSLGEKSSFYASLGFSNQEGAFRVNQETKSKYNINLGYTTKLTENLTADFKVMSINSTYKYPFNYYGGSGTDDTGFTGYFGYLSRWGQYQPNFGTYRGYNFRSGGGYLSNASQNKDVQINNRLSAKLTEQITKDFNIIGEFNAVQNNYNRKQNGGKFQIWDSWSSMPYDATTIQTAVPATLETGNDFVGQSKASTFTRVANIYGNYTKKINDKHNIKLLGGFNSEWSDFERTYSRRNTLMDKDRPEFNLATGDQFVSGAANTTLNPAVTAYAIAGFFARVNYDYNGIYLLELNGRYDGSSKFPTDQQWGFFPSASVGYRISNEKFMENTRSWLSDLKLRASVGSIGNQNIADNAFLPIMSSSNPFWTGSGTTIPPSVSLPTNVDPNLTWEKVSTADVGIDVRIFDMLGITFDWYQRDTKGMLSPSITLPATFGTTSARTNSGNLRTRGWELALNFNKTINPNVNVYADFSLSDYTTVVTEWNNSTKLLTDFYAGYELGQIWGLSSDRLLQSTDTFDTAGKTVNGVDYSSTITGSFKYGPGDVHYIDSNGDKAITRGAGTADDHGDLRVIGNTTPHFQYGVRLGADLYGFDVEAFFQGVGERSYWANSDAVLPFVRAPQEMYAKQADYWTPENTDAYWPRPYYGSEAGVLGATTQGSNNFITQDRYLLNMAYVRLKNLTVGYTIPKEYTKKAGLDKIRLYTSGQNLLTWCDSRLPVDPEINESEVFWGRTYPYMRTWSIGLDLVF